MDINAEKIKALRHSKGWTQQHLSEICGLSLRTIQRVERHGAASKETALSLCAAFEQTIETILPLEGESGEQEETVHISLYVQISIFVIGGVLGALLMKLFG